jgi:hypothetical protein
MTAPDDEQRELNARLRSALKKNRIYTRRDKQNRLFASDGEHEYEVAVTTDEADANYGHDGAPKLIIGQRTLRELEGGSIGALFWWGYQGTRWELVDWRPFERFRRPLPTSNSKPGMYWNPEGRGLRYWDGREWGPISQGTSPTMWVARIVGVAIIVASGWAGCTAITNHHNDSPTPAKSSTPASATPPPSTTPHVETPQERYLARLASEGITVDDDTALTLGAMVCTGIQQGLDDDEIVAQLRHAAHINSHKANVILSTARFDLCSR